MSYRVRIESFEGPFDLLLYLVNRQKVDIGSISITEITDQYLAEVERMSKVDLDVASDFLLVAATLLEIKAASLIASNDDEELEEYEDLSPMKCATCWLLICLNIKNSKMQQVRCRCVLSQSKECTHVPLALIEAF